MTSGVPWPKEGTTYFSCLAVFVCRVSLLLLLAIGSRLQQHTNDSYPRCTDDLRLTFRLLTIYGSPVCCINDHFTLESTLEEEAIRNLDLLIWKSPFVAPREPKHQHRKTLQSENRQPHHHDLHHGLSTTGSTDDPRAAADERICYLAGANAVPVETTTSTEPLQCLGGLGRLKRCRRRITVDRWREPVRPRPGCRPGYGPLAVAEVADGLAAEQAHFGTVDEAA